MVSEGTHLKPLHHVIHVTAMTTGQTRVGRSLHRQTAEHTKEYGSFAGLALGRPLGLRTRPTLSNELHALDWRWHILCVLEDQSPLREQLPTE